MESTFFFDNLVNKYKEEITISRKSATKDQVQKKIPESTHSIFNTIKPLDSEILLPVCCFEKFHNSPNVFLFAFTLKQMCKVWIKYWYTRLNRQNKDRLLKLRKRTSCSSESDVEPRKKGVERKRELKREFEY